MSQDPAQILGQKSIAFREAHPGGLIDLKFKTEITNPEELATFYTPGVGAVCKEVAQSPERAKELTVMGSTMAIISDGTAVLGFGDLGPAGVMPVLEGKAMILKSFGGVSSVPMILDTKDTEEIISTIKNIAPSFAGIFLEDISAPRCFEIEDRLSEMLDMPVFHDDQHGTAIVVLAGLMNALKVVKKDKKDIRVVIAGAGAAGIAIGKLLKAWDVHNITLVDSKGIVSNDRDVPAYKAMFASDMSGGLADAVAGADVFLGVSKAGLLSQDMVRSMADDAIVFAMANPIPEITPNDAIAAGAAVVATGRSDFPNQINNALVFPGLMRGLLEKGVKKVTPEIKLRCASAVAAMIADPAPENIIPGVFTDGIHDTVAASV